MNKVCEDEELVAFGSTVGNVLPRFLRRVYNKNSSELRAKNSPQDCFFNALSSHAKYEKWQIPRGICHVFGAGGVT